LKGTNSICSLKVSTELYWISLITLFTDLVLVTESGREQSGACKTNTGQHNLSRRSSNLSSWWHMLPSGLWTVGLLSIACSK